MRLSLILPLFSVSTALAKPVHETRAQSSRDGEKHFRRSALEHDGRSTAEPSGPGQALSARQIPGPQPMPSTLTLLYLHSHDYNRELRFHISYSLKLPRETVYLLNKDTVMMKHWCEVIFGKDIRDYLQSVGLRYPTLTCHFIEFPEGGGGLFGGQWRTKEDLDDERRQNSYDAVRRYWQGIEEVEIVEEHVPNAWLTQRAPWESLEDLVREVASRAGDVRLLGVDALPD